MPPEEQRIEIAKACGLDATQDMWEVSGLPNYLTDLNAMHEAEKCIPDRDSYWDGYEWHLTSYARDSRISNIRALITATAAQRAEAFLRTIGKWKD